jgi:hypothetical protein
MPALTLVSMLERYLGLQTAMPRGDIRKRPSAHLLSMVYETDSSPIAAIN